MKEIREGIGQVFGPEDFLDKAVKRYDSYGFFCHAGLYLALDSVLNFPYSPLLAYGSLAAVRALDVYKGFRQKAPTGWDKQLKYTSTEIAYKGRPASFGNVEMEKGDSFLYVQFPLIWIDPSFIPDEETLAPLFLETVRAVVLDAADSTQTFSYKAAVISTKMHPLYEESGAGAMLAEGLKAFYYPGAKNARYMDLTSGRSLAANETHGDLIILSREEFKSPLPPKIDELFLRACLLSQDTKIIHDYLPAMRTAQTEEEKERAMREIRSYVKQKFAMTLEDAFGGPSLRSVQGSHVTSNNRERVSTSVFLRNQKGESVVQRITSSQQTVSEIRSNSTDSLLNVSEKDIEEVLENNPTRAQVNYIISEMLRVYSYDELFLSSQVDIDSLLRHLEENSISLEYPQGVYKTIVNDKNTAFKRFFDIYTHVSSAFRSIVLFALLQSGIDTLSSFDRFPSLFHHEEGSDQNNNNAPFSARFGALDGRGEVEWKVSTTGLDTSGYYTTDVAGAMFYGEWVDASGSKEVIYPHNIEETIKDPGGEIVLERVQSRHADGGSAMIPIKDGTMLSALRVEDRGGNIIKTTTYLYDNGTVWVFIPDGVGEFVKITALLKPSDVPQIHASGRVDPPIGDLGANATETFFDALPETQIDESEKWSDLEEDRIAEEVASRHKYSVDPKYNTYLEGLETSEDVVNAIADLGFCDCDVCNTEVVLLASLLPNTEVNMASGFFLNVENVASGQGEYLTSLAMHAYGVDEKGRILDGTPSDIAHDDATLEYLSNLSGGTSYDEQWDDTEDKFHNKSIGEFIDEYQQDISGVLKDHKLEATLLTLLVAGLALRKPVYEQYKKIEEKKAAYRMIERSFVSALTLEELTYMHTFFLNISYNSEAEYMSADFVKKLYKEREGKYESKVDVFEAMRSDTNKRKLRKFLADPEKYEQNLNLSLNNRAKLRIMAKMLVNHRYRLPDPEQKPTSPTR